MPKGAACIFCAPTCNCSIPTSGRSTSSSNTRASRTRNELRPTGMAGADPSTHYLTSRVNILIDANDNNAPLLPAFIPTIAAVLPARFVPDFGVFRASRISAFVGVGLGALGNSLANPELHVQASSPVALRTGAFGKIGADMLPRAMRARAQPRAALFGTNTFPRPVCGAVRILSASRCLEVAAKDPELPDWQQKVVRVTARGMRGGVGVVVTDRRIPTLGIWPHGLPALPQRPADGYGVGGAIVARTYDPMPDVEPPPGTLPTLPDGISLLQDADGSMLLDADGAYLAAPE